MKHFRMISLLLALCLMCSLAPAAMAKPLLIAPAPSAVQRPARLLPTVKTYSGTLTDAEGAWCEDAIQTVYETGLMEGKTTDRFDITAPLTHAQIVVVCARLRSLLTGGGGTLPRQENQPWYQSAYESLWAAMENHELFIPDYLVKEYGHYQNMANQPCTRGAFVRTLSYAMLDTGVSLPAINNVTVLPDVRPETYFGNITEAVFDFYNAGILTGTDAYGTFDEYGTLNRGQAAAMLARLADPTQRKTLDLKPFDFCREVVQLEPATVLAVIDGVEITADQAALIMAYNSQKDALLECLAYRVALMRLTEQRGIVWSETDIDVTPGWRGISEAGWVWHRMDTHLFTLLNGSPPDPHARADGFYDTLDAEIAAVQSSLSVVTTPTLDAFDFDVFRTRRDASAF